VVFGLVEVEDGLKGLVGEDESAVWFGRDVLLDCLRDCARETSFQGSRAEVRQLQKRKASVASIKSPMCLVSLTLQSHLINIKSHCLHCSHLNSHLKVKYETQ
jgi:hypothetical protein